MSEAPKPLRHLLHEGRSLCDGLPLVHAGALEGGDYGDRPVADCPECLDKKGDELKRLAQELRKAT